VYRDFFARPGGAFLVIALRRFAAALRLRAAALVALPGGFFAPAFLGFLRGWYLNPVGILSLL